MNKKKKELKLLAIAHCNCVNSEQFQPQWIDQSLQRLGILFCIAIFSVGVESNRPLLQTSTMMHWFQFAPIGTCDQSDVDSFLTNNEGAQKCVILFSGNVTLNELCDEVCVNCLTQFYGPVCEAESELALYRGHCGVFDNDFCVERLGYFYFFTIGQRLCLNVNSSSTCVDSRCYLRLWFLFGSMGCCLNTFLNNSNAAADFNLTSYQYLVNYDLLNVCSIDPSDPQTCPLEVNTIMSGASTIKIGGISVAMITLLMMFLL